MKIRYVLLLFLWVLNFSLISCGLKEPLPDLSNNMRCYSVNIADGPEDFVFDQWNKSERLIVSCHERRKPAKTGDIYAFDIKSHKVKKLLRTGEPSKIIAFKPHGMDILRKNDETLLYVIIHDPYDHSKRLENVIGVYRVMENELQFVDLLEDNKHLWSPNDLSVLKSGEIYVTNDYHSLFELYLKINASDIAHFNPKNRKWDIAASGLGFANGILALPDKVYISITISNKLIRFKRNEDGTFGDKEVVVDLKGPDNIMSFKDKIIVAAHFNDLAFLWHQKSKKATSPSVLFMIDPKQKSKKAIFTDDGKLISAASCGLIYGEKLYIAQVYNPYIMICDSCKWEK